LIFSIAIGADYSFDIKSGFSIAPAFSLHKNFGIASVYLVLLCSAPSWKTSMHCRVVVHQATGYLVLLCITLYMVQTVHPPITYLNAQIVAEKQGNTISLFLKFSRAT
jgi:hypothetical protein